MNPTDIQVTLDSTYAAEIAATLLWLRDWFSYDPDTLAASMRRHSYGLFTLPEVDCDLSRFIYALGGDDL